MRIENECTCPVGFECKHVAALLIAGLEHQPKQPVSGVRPELVAWLEGLRAARTAPVTRSKKPATVLLTATQPCWYLDAQSGEADPISLPWSAGQIGESPTMPPITLKEAALVGNVLQEVAPDLPLPPANDAAGVRAIDATPIPRLLLDTRPVRASGWSSATPSKALDFATIVFNYAGHDLDARSNTTLLCIPDGDVIQIKRQFDIEQRRLMELHQLGLRKVPARRAHGPQPFPDSMLAPQNPDDWSAFIQIALPALRQNGWLIAMTDTFRHNMIEIDAIDGSLRQSDGGWFNIEMGIAVNGRTVRLEPLLADLFRRDTRWLSGKLDEIADDEAIELKTDRNERLRLRADRLKPIVRVLVDLLDRVSDGVQISEWNAARLAALDDTGRWQFHGDASIRQRARRLMAGPGVVDVPVPQG